MNVVFIGNGNTNARSIKDTFQRANLGPYTNVQFQGSAVGLQLTASINANLLRLAQNATAGNGQALVVPQKLAWMLAKQQGHFSELTLSAVSTPASTNLWVACVVNLNVTTNVTAGFYGMFITLASGAVSIARCVFSGVYSTSPTNTNISGGNIGNANPGDVLRLIAQPQANGSWNLSATKNGVAFGGPFNDNGLGAGAVGMPGISYTYSAGAAATMDLSEYAAGVD